MSQETGSKTLSINWLVPQQNQAAFERTARFLGLETSVIGQPGQEIQGAMSPIEVPDNCLGISIAVPDSITYHSQQSAILCEAAYEGILPKELTSKK